MAIHSDALESYLEELATPADAVLREMTQVGRERGFPIIGPQVGRFLQQLAAGIGARRIFELGSGFGYSTLWFAKGLAEGGVIHHTDGDEANAEQAREYLTRAGVVERVRFHVGDAVGILRALEDTEPFDIVFCDIDKHGYPQAYEEMRTRVRVGGFVVIDNLIWSERILDASRTDADTEGIRAYTRAMWNDPDFLSSMLPIRDGVGLHLRLR